MSDALSTWRGIIEPSAKVHRGDGAERNRAAWLEPDVIEAQPVSEAKSSHTSKTNPHIHPFLRSIIPPKRKSHLHAVRETGIFSLPVQESQASLELAFSMAMIVCRVTPNSLARSSWRSPACFLNSFTLFFVVFTLLSNQEGFTFLFFKRKIHRLIRILIF